VDAALATILVGFDGLGLGLGSGFGPSGGRKLLTNFFGGFGGLGGFGFFGSGSIG
jgi:hypothetical protein